MHFFVFISNINVHVFHNLRGKAVHFVVCFCMHLYLTYTVRDPPSPLYANIHFLWISPLALSHCACILCGWPPCHLSVLPLYEVWKFRFFKNSENRCMGRIFLFILMDLANQTVFMISLSFVRFWSCTRSNLVYTQSGCGNSWASLSHLYTGHGINLHPPEKATS